MKLVSLSFNSIPRMPGFRAGDICVIESAKPQAFLGWRVSIRGERVFFVSPPGWEAGSTKVRAGGPVTIFETSRIEVTFQWSGNELEIETILKGGKYDSEPLGPPPELAKPKSLLDQVPASQLGDS